MYYEIKSWSGLHGYGRLIEHRTMRRKPAPQKHPQQCSLTACMARLENDERQGHNGIKYADNECVWQTHNLFGNMATCKG